MIEKKTNSPPLMNYDGGKVKVETEEYPSN